MLPATASAEKFILGFLKAAPNVPPVETAGTPAHESTELHPARQAIERNPIHDENNPDRHLLQSIDDATRHIAKDKIGFPDWMSAIRSGAIKPLDSIDGKGTMNLLDLDVVMRNTREMPNVKFPHLSHTMWLDCGNCHPKPFLPKVGANAVSMEKIFRGEFCGMCHDRVAFVTFFSCERCHSVPQGASQTQR